MKEKMELPSPEEQEEATRMWGELRGLSEGPIIGAPAKPAKMGKKEKAAFRSLERRVMEKEIIDSAVQRVLPLLRGAMWSERTKPDLNETLGEYLDRLEKLVEPENKKLGDSFLLREKLCMWLDDLRVDGVLSKKMKMAEVITELQMRAEKTLTEEELKEAVEL